jgi:hypothetical protein
MFDFPTSHAMNKRGPGRCDLVNLRGGTMKNYGQRTRPPRRRRWQFAEDAGLQVGKATRHASISNRHDAVFDGEVNELGVAVQPVRFHHLVLMKFDGPRRY